MKIDRVKILIFAGIILLALVILVLLPGDFIRNSIAYPIYYVFWSLSMIIGSVDQTLFWGVLGVVGTLAAVISLALLIQPIHKDDEQILPAKDRSRFRFWLIKCLKMDVNEMYRDDLAYSLWRLLRDVLIYQENADWKEVLRRANTGQLNIPEGLIPFLYDRRLVEPSPRKRFINRLVFLFQPAKKTQNLNPTSDMHQRVEAVILFLEERLEMNNDRNEK